MKLGRIYDFFIQEGIKADLRGRQLVSKQVQVARKEYRDLTGTLKKFFDRERFKNPYPDTRILHGNPHQDIRHILVGIDIDVSEILLADRLRRQGHSIDLVLSHHPQGKALAGLMEVMKLQTDLLQRMGIAPEIAKDLMNRRISEVARRMHSANYARVSDAARLLDIPLMCCHTVADNHVASYLQRGMDARKPKTLKAVIDFLLREPEFQNAAVNQFGPKILVGQAKDPAGKIFVDMTGGTEGSKEVYARLSQLGISTVLCMHLSENHFEKIKKDYLKVVNAGHMASDMLGMNLVLDKLQRQEKLTILECSGFRRFKR